MFPQKKAEEKLLDAAMFIRNRGYKPVYIALHGSQNYGLDTPQSDFDFQCIVVPTLDDLIGGVTISTVVEYEGGQIEVKDIREQVRSLNKMNPSYIETFLTPYAISLCDVPEIEEIKNLIPLLLEERGRPYMEALFGIFSRYEIRTPIDGWKDYNPKAGYEMMRSVCMMEAYMHNKGFLMVPDADDLETIMSVKTHKFRAEFLSPLYDALWTTASSLIDSARTTFQEPSYETANQITALSKQMLRRFIINEEKIFAQED